MEHNDSFDPHGPDSVGDAQPEDPHYGPVPLRYRHDGWVPDRQLEFIQALSACGCVDEAAKSVGMSRASAYALRARPDAQAFRLAWDAAMDAALERLSEAALGRAINGVPVPIFHKGEQVGERRHFDERLTMFLLRTRYSIRYGRWIDKLRPEEEPEARITVLAIRIARLTIAAWRNMSAALNGKPCKDEREPRTWGELWPSLRSGEGTGPGTPANPAPPEAQTAAT